MSFKYTHDEYVYLKTDSLESAKRWASEMFDVVHVVELCEDQDPSIKGLATYRIKADCFK